MKIRINGIVSESIVDGPGIRYVIFAQGCYHNCPGCHNPDTHNPTSGFDYEISKILCEIKENPLITGVTFSGGEPMLQAEKLYLLALELKKINKSIMIYSGFTFEEIISNDKMFELLKLCDILVDGKFDDSQKSLLLTFKGSKNQRIIDIQKTISKNEIVEMNF